MSKPHVTLGGGALAIAALSLLAASPSPASPQLPAPVVPTAVRSHQAADLQPTAAPTPENQPLAEAIAPFEAPDARGNFRFGLGEGDWRYGFGSILPDPTVLRGATRELVVPALDAESSLFPIGIHVQRRLTETQALTLEAQGDPRLLAADLTYTWITPSQPGAWSANFNHQRSRYAAFEEGGRAVNLPNGDDPWVYRLGGGVEYQQAVGDRLAMAWGANYQRVSVRDGLLSGDRAPRDELNNPLTVSPDGRDDLLLLAWTGLYDSVAQDGLTWQGTRLRFGAEQSLPIGEADILLGRLSGNASQFLALRDWGLGSDAGTLIANLQGGVSFGDVPPYETFNLGGSDSVRGFSSGEIGSGRGFVQVSLEYRLPLATLTIFEQDIGLGVAAFTDYGTTLQTDDAVIGQPAIARQKPGDGWGYGVGFLAGSSVGLFRVEAAWNDRGGNQFSVTVGDRF